MIPSGRVVWITGLSGAGKTTVARRLVGSLRQAGTACIHLDGDELREVLADPNYGFDRESRLRGAGIYQRLALLCARQGLVAVVSTISLFREVHSWNRANLPGYFEVFLDVSESVRVSRDPKGLYASSRAGSLPQMPGIDLPPDLPEHPDLRIANDGGPDGIEGIARRIAEATGLLP